MRRLMQGALALLAAQAAPAGAEWMKATSRHFQIYSDGSPDQLRQLATRLEKVDGALRVVSGAKDTAESAANPVTVYVLDSAAAIQRLSGDRDIAGFYAGRASGSVAFTPRRGDERGLDPQLVLFHEYAHHYLLSQSSIAYPAWLSEGYAEFVGTARFPDEGVMIGAPAQHRAYGLLVAAKLPLRLLFDPPEKMSAIQRDQLYGRGWLLTHYLLLGGERKGQLGAYLTALDAGTPPLAAAEKGFGDLKQLDRDLDGYLNRSKISAATIRNERLPAIAVDVRPLTPGERALIAMRMTSTRGVDRETAGPLFARAAKAAEPYPADVAAQGWLAEMAFDAGAAAAAETAADRALAADPKSVQALLYKARIRLRGLVAAKAPADDKGWAEARSWIVKANRVDANAAAPLLLYYDSFGMAGATPTKQAGLGLIRAQELAPQDDGLRFRAARQLLLEGETAEAKRTLRPLAFAAHAPANNPAARLLAMVDGGAAGPAAIAMLDAEAAQAAKKGE